MIRFIDAVTRLTALRHKEDLDTAFAEAAFDLVRPARLSLWHVAHDHGVAQVGECLRIECPRDILRPSAGTPQFVDLDACRGLRECFATRTPLAARAGVDGLRQHVFPVLNGDLVVGLLELCRSTRLRPAELRNIIALLRVHHNILAVLDESQRDTLTGLLNRRTFDDRFRRCCHHQPARQLDATEFEYLGRRRPDNADRQPWLAAVDIDHFKRINDRFGHAYGDEVLILFAGILRNTLRDADQVFRFGGEEFVIILDAMEKCFAMQVLERCRQAVERYDFPQVGRVTASFGLTGIYGDDSAVGAVGRADEALYFAKENGRNQVHWYEQLVSTGMLKTQTLVAQCVEFF